MSGAARLALALSFLVASACRTVAPSSGKPFAPLASVTPETAWQELVARRHGFSGARAFARTTAITRQGRQSFKTILAFAPDGSFRVEVLSPVGTRALSLSVRDRQVVREGSGEARSIEDLGRIIGVPAADWTASEIAMLLLGLPPDPNDRQRFEYQVGAQGLVGVRSGTVEVCYEPPRFPPQKVRFRTESGESFELEYLELLEL